VIKGWAKCGPRFGTRKRLDSKEMPIFCTFYKFASEDQRERPDSKEMPILHTLY
jgi:hypothetical protein